MPYWVKAPDLMIRHFQFKWNSIPGDALLRSHESLDELLSLLNLSFCLCNRDKGTFLKNK